ncbi:MAG: hypothetical protein LBB63_03040 [Holosporaceae bacterium]|nr:hypothetical protein [Holosporaceae bacterium]
MKKVILIVGSSALASIADVPTANADVVGARSAAERGGKNAAENGCACQSGAESGWFLGLGIGPSFVTSDYAMDFSVNPAGVEPGAGGIVRHNGKSGKLGSALYGGYVWSCGGCVTVGEIGVNLGHHKVGKLFSDREGREGIVVGDPYLDTPMSELKTTYGNEVYMALKFGGKFHDSLLFRRDVLLYVVSGVGYRKVRTEYSYLPHVNYNVLFDCYNVNYKRLVLCWSLGAGGEVVISKKFSIGLEYRHKFFSKSKATRNFYDVPLLFGGGGGDSDTKPRNYGVKTGEDSLCLRFVVHL